MNRFALFAALAIMTVATPAAAQTTIAQAAADGTDYGAYFIGQSFTAGAAGSNYNNIKFSFIAITGGGNVSQGNLYIFSNPYTGTPNGLATAAGVLGSASAASGTYTFTPSFTLVGGTQYYAYSNTSQDPGGNNTNPYAGGQAYYSSTATGTYIATPDFDNAFRVTALAAAAPEPATWALLILGFGMAGYVLRRRKVVLGGTVAA